MIKCTETHEWIAVEGNIGTVGITNYAQKELGDVVYVELPKIGKSVNAGQEAVVLESTKAAADVYSPVTGTILEVNQELAADSGLINQSPEQRGWLFKLRIADLAELKSLIDKDDYDKQHEK